MLQLFLRNIVYQNLLMSIFKENAACTEVSKPRIMLKMNIFWREECERLHLLQSVVYHLKSTSDFILFSL